MQVVCVCLMGISSDFDDSESETELLVLSGPRRQFTRDPEYFNPRNNRRNRRPPAMVSLIKNCFW